MRVILFMLVLLVPAAVIWGGVAMVNRRVSGQTVRRAELRSLKAENATLRALVYQTRDDIENAYMVNDTMSLRATITNIDKQTRSIKS